MSTYSGLRVWKQNLDRYGVEYPPDGAGKAALLDWTKAVYQVPPAAAADWAQLALQHQNLYRQLSDALDEVDAAVGVVAATSSWWLLHSPLVTLQARLGAALKALDALPTGPPAGDSDERPGFMSVRQLAEKYGVDRDALEARLRRWRKKSIADSAWIKHDSRRKNEPRFLYREDAVHEEIQTLKVSDGRRTEKI